MNGWFRDGTWGDLRRMFQVWCFAFVLGRIGMSVWKGSLRNFLMEEKLEIEGK